MSHYKINKMLLYFMLLLSVLVNCDLQEMFDLPEGSLCVDPVGFNVIGVCVNLYKCPEVLPDIIVPKKQFKRYKVCSFNGHTPIICCSSCSLVTNITDAVVTKTGFLFWKNEIKSWNQCLKYSLTLPYKHENAYVTLVNVYDPTRKCYNLSYIAPGVGGGWDVQRMEYPHMVLLGYGNCLPNVEWLCAGSIISENYVLTAAHCFDHRGSVAKYIAAGILKRSDPAEYWQIHDVDLFILHPEYAPPSKYHDIALIRIKKQFVFSPSVLPACLPYPELDKYRSFLVATGWGDLGYRCPLADNLQAVLLRERSAEECSLRYKIHRHLQHGYNHSIQMCCADARRNDCDDYAGDTCQGDSGGPLQYYSSEVSIHVVIGVTSFGKPCGFAGGSGVYTRVKHYIPWIENHVWP